MLLRITYSTGYTWHPPKQRSLLQDPRLAQRARVCEQGTTFHWCVRLSLIPFIQLERRTYDHYVGIQSELSLTYDILRNMLGWDDGYFHADKQAPRLKPRASQFISLFVFLSRNIR